MCALEMMKLKEIVWELLPSLCPGEHESKKMDHEGDGCVQPIEGCRFCIPIMPRSSVYRSRDRQVDMADRTMNSKMMIAQRFSVAVQGLSLKVLSMPSLESVDQNGVLT
ncbi:hypothetical protein CRG98_026019 [Punica granatum]|uniref:Uncharacterized protein n=1 Tax=Punica granatum TaxID=22663 RepID=A0A2I0JBD6_PUNGR|nr:hypothetical protein CRG98_026019 [Punica granatum]